MAEIQRYPKRLIEVDLPIRRISAHARREKSIRHGHISTLHIWWARRPLAACRAVLCAALWPDPADPLCPESFRQVAKKEMRAWATSHMKLLSPESYSRFNGITREPKKLDDSFQLRKALLDFVADFSNWDNASVAEFLTTSRALTQAAHEALGGEADTRPLVFDPFAGGGSFPLEAMRIGADAFASDLNPIPVLLNRAILEYACRYGESLAATVRNEAARLRGEAQERLAAFYPVDEDGGIPIAFLWARTIKCEGPACGVEVPLIRNLQLTRVGRKWHLQMTPVEKGVEVRLQQGSTETMGTVRNGSVTCPCCGYTTAAGAVRTQLGRKRGGSRSPRLLAVYTERDGLRTFREPTQRDISAFDAAATAVKGADLPDDEINAIRPYKNTRGLSAVTRIGLTRFGDLYNPRQALALLVFRDLLLKSHLKTEDATFRRAVLTFLSFIVSRYIFQNCALSRWNATGAKIEGAFGKQALQVVWDFAEANPFSNGSANWNNAVDWVVEVIQANGDLAGTGTSVRGAAQTQMLPNDSVQLLATDPPYFAAIPYSDLSNVFYVWEREFIEREFPELFAPGLIDQRDEIIVTNANKGHNGREKSPAFFEDEMTKSLEAARVSVGPGGAGVIVFADSKTESWEAILGAIIRANWIITGSWPIDTEMQSRTGAQSAASLQSSIHIVCRPRENSDGSVRTDDVGDWREILRELPRRIHEWMPRLAEEGVVGADAIFACLGPALEIYSRYSRVEKTSGEIVPLREYLEHVWAAVSKEALSMIFRDAETSGLEPDARLTAMWLWTLAAPTGTETADAAEATGDEDAAEEDEAAPKAKTAGFALEYDAARKIAQGLGARLEELVSVVEVKGDKARLLSVGERAKALFAKAEKAAAVVRKKAAKQKQMMLFEEDIDQAAEEQGWEAVGAPAAGKTTLDRVHQAMLLFGTGRSEALKRFLVEEGVGRQAPFWKLAQALSALYAAGCDEKRWVDGVLARKKSLGF